MFLFSLFYLIGMLITYCVTVTLCIKGARKKILSGIPKDHVQSHLMGLIFECLIFSSIWIITVPLITYACLVDKLSKIFLNINE